MSGSSTSQAAQAVYDEARADRVRKDGDALAWVLSDERGRRFMRRLLHDACGIDAPTIGPGRPIETAHLWEGRRHVGIDLLVAIDAADQDARERMDAEAAVERTEARQLTTAAEAAQLKEEKTYG